MRVLLTLALIESFLVFPSELWISVTEDLFATLKETGQEGMDAFDRYLLKMCQDPTFFGCSDHECDLLEL
jgi:hypothetical protein